MAMELDSHDAAAAEYPVFTVVDEGSDSMDEDSSATENPFTGASSAKGPSSSLMTLSSAAQAFAAVTSAVPTKAFTFGFAKDAWSVALNHAPLCATSVENTVRTPKSPLYMDGTWRRVPRRRGRKKGSKNKSTLLKEKEAQQSKAPVSKKAAPKVVPKVVTKVVPKVVPSAPKITPSTAGKSTGKTTSARAEKKSKAEAKPRSSSKKTQNKIVGGGGGLGNSPEEIKKNQIQGKMCRGLPHTALPPGFSKFFAPTSHKQFKCGICKREEEIGDPQGQWHRRDLICDPEICAVCMDCWKVYTNFTEKVKKEPGYREFVLTASHIYEVNPVDLETYTTLVVDALWAAFASHYFRRRTGGAQVVKSRNNSLIAQYFWSDILGPSGLSRACFCKKVIPVGQPWSRCECWGIKFKSNMKDKDGRGLERMTQFREEMKAAAITARVGLIQLLESKYTHVEWGRDILTELKRIDAESA